MFCQWRRYLSEPRVGPDQRPPGLVGGEGQEDHHIQRTLSAGTITRFSCGYFDQFRHVNRKFIQPEPRGVAPETNELIWNFLHLLPVPVLKFLRLMILILCRESEPEGF